MFFCCYHTRLVLLSTIRTVRTITERSKRTMATAVRRASDAVTGPTVVLIGWLGCQQKNLRRYEALYSGCRVISRIPKPAQVVQTILERRPPAVHRELISPPTWPYPASRSLTTFPTMTDIAWDTLADMDATESPAFVVHVFSNGGGLCWEAMAGILEVAHTFPGPVRQRLHSIEERLVAIVVDSAPSPDLYRLPDAMRWVPLQDQLALVSQPSLAYQWWCQWKTPAIQNMVKERVAIYWKFWTTSPLSIRLPHLFLYSADDPLANAPKINELATRLGAEQHCWDRSGHVAHLFHHPVEYKAIVDKFVRTNLERPAGWRQSRL